MQGMEWLGHIFTILSIESEFKNAKSCNLEHQSVYFPKLLNNHKVDSLTLSFHLIQEIIVRRFSDAAPTSSRWLLAAAASLDTLGFSLGKNAENGKSSRQIMADYKPCLTLKATFKAGHGSAMTVPSMGEGLRAQGQPLCIPSPRLARAA